ncbi:hypothetical protein N566_14480 [Streptomycetaceae bacterium MP113-05]|nr:hypothetical protein N566_14480 [Streptomycetaceae bacterium MP113-05]
MSVSSFSPPRIPAHQLRPGRHWYVTAVAIAVAMIVLSVALAVYRFNSAVDAVNTDNQWANGETVTLRLEPEREKAIWVMYPGMSPGPRCDITGPGDPALTEGTDVSLTFDETWDLVYTTDVQQAGDYTVTCSSQAVSRYAIGDSGGMFTFVGWLILAVLLSVLGIGICAVIVVVTAVRRRGHRKRLLAERLGSGGGCPARPGAAGAFGE